ncbi:AN1-type zinc finger protein 1 [Apiospora aurea]|uniref:AN1-type zinc finger protein 1 n=1 Tax=Apiospora aurea TaxID=335848 RepID=A0ABR1QIC7_9PEZI
MASPSSNSENPDTSYVKMDTTADATLIGTHCDPASTPSASTTGPRPPTDAPTRGPGPGDGGRHSSPSPARARGKRMRDFVAQKPCAGQDCKTTVGTSLMPGVHCDRCNRDYCLKHRLQEDHDCKNLVPLGARPSQQKIDAGKEAARSAFARFKAWGTQKREQASRALPKPKPTSASARLVAVNNLKKTAKGDAKLPAEKRVYLYVEAEAETTTAKFPKGEFFFSKDWVIGRLLDVAAKGLQVENVNNSSADEKDKLRVFHVEGGRILEYNEKIGVALTSGNTVVLLRGVGAPEDLIQM